MRTATATLRCRSPTPIAPVAARRPDRFAAAGRRPTSTAPHAVLAARRRERASADSATRSRWWYLPALLGILLCCTWGLLRLDQWFADAGHLAARGRPLRRGRPPSTARARPADAWSS